MMVDITGLKREAVIMALYENARDSRAKFESILRVHFLKNIVL